MRVFSFFRLTHQVLNMIFLFGCSSIRFAHMFLFPCILDFATMPLDCPSFRLSRNPFASFLRLSFLLCNIHAIILPAFLSIFAPPLASPSFNPSLFQCSIRYVFSSKSSLSAVCVVRIADGSPSWPSSRPPMPFLIFGPKSYTFLSCLLGSFFLDLLISCQPPAPPNNFFIRPPPSWIISL